MEKKYNPKHPLTDEPGGVTLKLEFADGSKTTQNRVKYPEKYVYKVLAEHGSNLVTVYDITRSEIVYDARRKSGQTQIEF